MIVWHGTGLCSLEGFLTTLPERKKRSYLNGKLAFCATVNFRVATMFAVRKTPVDDFLASNTTGVVLEFELTGKEGRDYLSAEDHRCLQDEQEVAVLNVKKLKLLAVWRHTTKGWKRGEPKLNV